MTDDKHTPGPWVRVGAAIMNEADALVLHTDLDGLLVATDADMALLLAAPQLLSALRDAVRWCRECDGSNVPCVPERQMGDDSPVVCPTCREWRAAFATAEGGSTGETR